MHARHPHPKRHRAALPPRRSAIVASLLAAAVLALPSADLAAQAAAPSGIWYGGTFGSAGVRLTCDLCQPTRDIGTAFTLSFGAHARPGLRVGVEGGQWSYDGDAVRERVLTLGLVAHLVPDARRGLYLIGGLGWSGYRAGDFTYDAPRLTVGAGWEFPPLGGVRLGPTIAVDAAAFTPLKNDGVTVVHDVGLSAVRVAMQVRKR